MMIRPTIQTTTAIHLEGVAVEGLRARPGEMMGLMISSGSTREVP